MLIVGDSEEVKGGSVTTFRLGFESPLSPFYQWAAKR